MVRNCLCGSLVSMRLVIVSDTHNMLNRINIPDGDVLIHCGDFCRAGTVDEVKHFNEVFSKLMHRYKIVVAGNHDLPFGGSGGFVGRDLLDKSIFYLEDEAMKIGGVKFYGTPGQFLLRRLELLEPSVLDRSISFLRGSSPNPVFNVWNWIPPDTDVLITHGPPHGILDREGSSRGGGCTILRRRLEKLQLKLHCFGHIHESYGHEINAGTLFVNAAAVDADYQPTNPPVVVDVHVGQQFRLAS